MAKAKNAKSDKEGKKKSRVKIKNYEDMLVYCVDFVRRFIKKKIDDALMPTFLVSDGKTLSIFSLLGGPSDWPGLISSMGNAIPNAKVVGLFIPGLRLAENPRRKIVWLAARDKEKTVTLLQPYETEPRLKIDKVEKVFPKQSRLTDALEPVKLS